MNHRSRSGFTLVEVITGIVVIAVISSASWMGVSTLMRGEQLSRNRTLAVNLLQKSQEELRAAALTYYDNLEKCQFPGPFFGPTNELCGLSALTAQFNGYTREVAVTPEHSSTEIKKAIITVHWTDKGDARIMNSAVLLARPPDPLPGNIFGTVRTSAPGNALIKDVSLTVTHVASGAQRTTTSLSDPGPDGENYNFYDAATGAFVLPVGTWRLKATHPSYHTYNHPTDITVTSNAPTRVDFFIEPRPVDGQLRIRLINANTRNLITNFRSGRIHILDDYQNTGQVVAYSDGATTFNRAISFTSTDSKIFTVNTAWAYRSGHAGRTFRNGPTNCNFEYNPRGWSSAVMLDSTNTSYVCNNPWDGSISSDRISVSPGETVNVDVALLPVPTATVRGRVVDQNGTPLAGAKVYAQWPSTTDWWYKDNVAQFATTDNNGEYSYTVPAVQEMYANDATGLLKIQARRDMTFMGCCDSPQSQERYSQWLTTNNLFEGSTVIVGDLIIQSGGVSNCGNVKGNLKDDLTNGPLSGANISIQGVGNATAASGDYIYQCSGPGYRLPSGGARFYASKSGYYSYDSGGNIWYAAAPNVNILTNSLVDYDAKLWPVGTGTVVVTVLDAGSNLPITGATVKLKTYTNSETSLVTGADGKATYNNYLETWPPAGLPNSGYYKMTPQAHSLTVTHPSGTYSSHSEWVTVLEKNTTLNIEVRLIPSGGA